MSSVAERYARQVDPAGEDSLAKIARWIRPGSSVLDVGTAGGALGRYLVERLGCVADGVERDLEAAALARPYYRRLVVADLDLSDLGALFPAGSYDYVVCADVLEHLKQPYGVLRSARERLREGGHLLVSIPNLAYAPLLAELLGGQLQYRPVGLLDETHLRFATRASLQRMIEEAGFTAVALERVTKPPHESEFDLRYLEAMPPAVRRFLEETEEAYTYQILIDAVAGGPRAEVSLERRSPQPLPLRFVARLYWRTAAAPYTEERQVVALGEMGAGLQTLRFELPPEARPAGLLLQLADRETVLELRRLRVQGPAGTVWSWEGETGELEGLARSGITFAGQHAVHWGREARLELPVGGEELARCAGGCAVEAEVAWPLSPEYQRVLRQVAEGSGGLAELAAERDRLGGLLDARLKLLRDTERAWQEAVQERDRAVALLEERLALLQDLTQQVRDLESGQGPRARRSPKPAGESDLVSYVFTSIAPNYLAKARVLAGTVKRYNPQARFCVWVADFDRPAWADQATELDEIFTLADLPVENLKGWTFKHSLVELCTAVKGFALQNLLARPDCGEVFYFDPDIVVFSRLDEMAGEFERGSVLLTPHLTEPERSLEAVLDNECAALKHGIYNLGFLAVRNDEEGKRFAGWWAARLQDLCYDEIPRGLFTDQRWVDLAPGFFESVAIVRDPGWNVATWNLTHRQVQGSRDEGFVVNGASPLRFFHFSGLDSGAQLAMLKKYGATMPALFGLRDWYLAECDRLAAEVPVEEDWALGRFGNGEPISREHRILYRQRGDLQAAFPDPYLAADVNASFYHWFEVNYRATVADSDSTAAMLSLYRSELERIHRSRGWRLLQRASSVWRRLRTVARA